MNHRHEHARDPEHPWWRRKRWFYYHYDLGRMLSHLGEDVAVLSNDVASLIATVGREARADRERDFFIMSALTDALDTLETNTTKIDGAADSAEAAFTRIAALIADLRANTTDQPTIDRINALSTALADRAAQLGAAVEASPT